MIRAVALVDMKKTPEEIKTEEIPYDKVTPKVDLYPYGLCISLDEDALAKLQLGPPEVGDMIQLIAMAKVTAVSARATDQGDCIRVELQITHMNVEGDSAEEAKEY